MSDPSKDFTPIQDEYDFFLDHRTVAAEAAPLQWRWRKPRPYVLIKMNVSC
jgi:hypothetical protein